MEFFIRRMRQVKIAMVFKACLYRIMDSVFNTVHNPVSHCGPRSNP